MRRADNALLSSQRTVRPALIENLSDAEIGYFHAPIFIHEYIFGLDVPMDDLLLVSVLQRLADLRHDGESLLGSDLARLKQLAKI